MINYLTSYSLFGLTHFIYFMLSAIGMGVIVGFFASRAFEWGYEVACSLGS
jgi:hypothetical protein